jgi:hypothetical protein
LTRPLYIIAFDIAWLIVVREIPALVLEFFEFFGDFDALSPNCCSFAGTMLLVDEFFKSFG